MTGLELKERIENKPTSVGLYGYADLQQLVASAPSDIVEGLIADRSVNVLVGDSNLGKTPLAVTLGLCVAAGTPFLGRKVAQGSVLYCDAETPPHDMLRMIETISKAVNLSEAPKQFKVFSLNFADEVSFDHSVDSAIREIVKVLQPKLVIIDPLRTFLPTAQSDHEKLIAALTPLRKSAKEVGCAWLLLHHRRKHNVDKDAPPLDTDPQGWLQESAGSQALVNHTDARLGVEPTNGPGEAEIILGGFVRSKGKLPPLYLGREYDEQSGEATGYVPLVGIALLDEKYQAAYMKLKDAFTFSEARHQIGGNSDSATKKFLSDCMSFGIARKDGKRYLKSVE